MRGMVGEGTVNVFWGMVPSRGMVKVGLTFNCQYSTRTAIVGPRDRLIA